MTPDRGPEPTGDVRPDADAPVVSVVVPCYRHADYLPTALASLAGQDVSVEIVVVDDGSPDDVAGAIGGHPGARLLSRPHAGVSAARNAGVEECRGRYLVFLDSDDRLLPGALAAGVACFDRHPDAGFVHGRYRFIHADGSPAGQPAAPWPSASGYLELVRSNYIGMLGTVLFRTEVVREAGGFRTDLVVGEDYELLLRIARSHPVFGHDAMVAEYRRYPTSASADAVRMLEAVMEVFELERRAAREADSPEATWRALEEGERFFKLFYGTRIVRQVTRYGLLEGRFSDAARWSGALWRRLGPKLALVELPPAVAVAAARKSRWILRDVWLRLRRRRPRDG